MALTEEELQARIHRLEEATKRANAIFYDKITKAPYFDDTNFKNNLPTFERMVVADGLGVKNLFAYYDINSNKMLVNITEIPKDISDDDLTVIVLHEFIHFLSANRDKKFMGFLTGDDTFLALNEGCTQYLAMSLVYGDRLTEAISRNIMYPKATACIANFINNGGSLEAIYSGYFTNDLKKTLASLDPAHKSLFVDMILSNQMLEEEKNAQTGLDAFQSQIDSVKNGMAK